MIHQWQQNYALWVWFRKNVLYKSKLLLLFKLCNTCVSLSQLMMWWLLQYWHQLDNEENCRLQCNENTQHKAILCIYRYIVKLCIHLAYKVLSMLEQCISLLQSINIHVHQKYLQKQIYIIKDVTIIYRVFKTTKCIKTTMLGYHRVSHMWKRKPTVTSSYLFPEKPNKLAFEEKLQEMPMSEVIYLLTSFANMASTRPGVERDFINLVAQEVYEVSL